MNLTLSINPLNQIEADALIVPVVEGDAALPAGLESAKSWFDALKASGEFAGKSGELVILHQPAGFKAKRLVVAGAGKTLEPRTLTAAVVRSLKSKGVKTAALALASPSAGHVEAAAEGALLGNWESEKHKSKSDAKFLESFTIAASGDFEAALRRGRILGESQNFTRDLVNEPANLLAPLNLADRAKGMCLEVGLEFDVLDQDRMKQLGMGSLLGVAQGSAEPPALIVIRYKPTGKPSSTDHLGLVGKGVTFDTGGVSIKPSEGMEKMKYDMAGGAAVLGAMRAIAQLKPSIQVTAFVPAVENMVGSRAQRPGDIVTSYSGKTIEVLNTDAEGRLILADAVTYAKKQGCTHLVDAATLTGAIVVALGSINVGAFTNNDAMLNRVLTAAKAEGEKMWHMPCEDEYRDLLKSPYADLANIGPRGAGSISAAWFIREFVDETPWVHLDIAGTAWLDDNKPYMPKGPTGVGVRTFVRLAESW
ncbi:MAG: leucyl aminopeptidase [Bryobacteraceae bacterium]